MPSVITPKFVFDSLERHLSTRKDLWHIVNGPKRETWFSAETIAALSHASPQSIEDGFRVYGEENHSELAAILNEFDPTFDEDRIKNADGSRRIPDVSIIENAATSQPIFFSVLEAKLISPNSTKAAEDVEMSSDQTVQLQSLLNTARGDGLLDQLERAHGFYPSAGILGLVYAVHRTGQTEHAQASTFFKELTRQIKSLYTGSNWELWPNGVMGFSGQVEIRPIGGMFHNLASIGLGIIQRIQA